MCRAGFLSVLLLTPTVTSLAASLEKPNFVVIVADDLGWADVGYRGSPIETPHLDRLATEGVRLEQHYAAPMCSPTRAALLSGRYWSRFGLTSATNSRVFPFDTVTLARAMEAQGYDTGLAGKWHLGSKSSSGPQHFGFEHSYGSLAGGVGPWNHRYKNGPHTHTWHRNGQLITERGHVTDLVTEEAIRFVETERDGPFFLYVAFTAVHHPLDEPEPWLERARQVEPTRAQYAASAMHMDDSIGRIIAALQASGARDETLVIFFSDNGGTVHPADGDNARYPGSYPQGERLGRNDPLRGRKTEVYEGGIRVPAFANWPARLQPRVVTAPLHVVDWMPTLCTLAGYAPARDLRWDGQNVWPILEGGLPDAPRTLYWAGVGNRTAALRHGDWKLVVHRGSQERIELFDLGCDPAEQHNLAEEHPQRVKELRQRLQAEAARDDDARVRDEE